MAGSPLAVIVGIGGQDGRLLEESLKSKKIITIGISRRLIFYPDGVIERFNICKFEDVKRLVSCHNIRWVYYLAAYHAPSEESADEYSINGYKLNHQVHVAGVHNFLECISIHSKATRLFYAASSLIFDGSIGPTQTEETPASPVGYYGLTKLQGMMLCRHYRQKHNIFASVGILYNHESVYRKANFLSMKVIDSAYAILNGRQELLRIGDLDAKADWGYAPDFIDAFQRILHLTDPSDFIVATGKAHSVMDFIQIVCEDFGVTASDFIVQDKSFPLRRTGLRVGDYSKLRSATGWCPRFDFRAFVRQLVADYIKLRRDQH